MKMQIDTANLTKLDVALLNTILPPEAKVTTVNEPDEALKGANDKLVTTIEQLNEEITSLNNENDALKEKNSELKAKVEELNGNIHELNVQLTGAKGELESTKTNLETANKEAEETADAKSVLETLAEEPEKEEVVEPEEPKITIATLHDLAPRLIAYNSANDVQPDQVAVVDQDMLTNLLETVKGELTQSQLDEAFATFYKSITK